MHCLPLLLDFFGAFSNWNACSANRSRADAGQNSYISTPKRPVAMNSFLGFHPLGPGGGLEHLGCTAYHYFWISLVHFPTGMLVLQADRGPMQTKIAISAPPRGWWHRIPFLVSIHWGLGEGQNTLLTLLTTTSGFLWGLFQLECVFWKQIPAGHGRK